MKSETLVLLVVVAAAGYLIYNYMQQRAAVADAQQQAQLALLSGRTPKGPDTVDYGFAFAESLFRRIVPDDKNRTKSSTGTNPAPQYNGLPALGVVSA